MKVISGNKVIYKFKNEMDSIAKVSSGDVVKIETNDHTMVLASGDTLDYAVNHIKESLNIEFEDAYLMASIAVDIKVSQVVDPKMTIRAAIPKYIVSTEKLIDLSC